MALQYFVEPVSAISYNNEDLAMPMGDDGLSGKYTALIKSVSHTYPLLQSAKKKRKANKTSGW